MRWPPVAIRLQVKRAIPTATATKMKSEKTYCKFAYNFLSFSFRSLHAIIYQLDYHRFSCVAQFNYLRLLLNTAKKPRKRQWTFLFRSFNETICRSRLSSCKFLCTLFHFEGWPIYIISFEKDCAIKKKNERKTQRFHRQNDRLIDPRGEAHKQK